MWDDFDKEWVGHTADVLVCFEYFACVTLGERHGKPLIIYDGMQYGVLPLPWVTMAARDQSQPMVLFLVVVFVILFWVNISEYQGAGVMGFPDKEWLTLPALRELVEHDVYVQSRVQHQVLANFEVCYGMWCQILEKDHMASAKCHVTNMSGDLPSTTVLF